ncbi:MAG: integrase arm-type DNA-binding domain-containing protein, partial [Phenylobacterium sp.]
MAAVTKLTIETAWRNRGHGGQLLRDDDVKGLVLAVHRDHAMWRLEYRLPGRHPETGKRWPNRALTLGRLEPGYHLREARATAREAKAQVARGRDPATEAKS